MFKNVGSGLASSSRFLKVCRRGGCDVRHRAVPRDCICGGPIMLPAPLSQELPQANTEAQKCRIPRRYCEICGLGTYFGSQRLDRNLQHH